MVNDQPVRTTRRLLLVTRILITLLGGLWLLFIIASRWAEGFTAEGIPTLLTRGGGVAILLVTSWRWPRLASVLLILVGISLFGGLASFTRGAPVSTRLIIGGPPIILGMLLFAGTLVGQPRPGGAD